MVGVHVFESQRYVSKMRLECSYELKNLTSKGASSVFEHTLKSLTAYFQEKQQSLRGTRWSEPHPDAVSEAGSWAYFTTTASNFTDILPVPT